MLVEFQHCGDTVFVRHDLIQWARDGSASDEDENGAFLVNYLEGGGDVTLYFGADEIEDAKAALRMIPKSDIARITDGEDV